MNRPKILVFAGSTRSGALSGKVAAAAAKELSLLDAEVTLISLADYTLPIYDGDLEDEDGVPDNAHRLARMIAAHGGLLISTPEYNRSLPPLLKNAIDWVSRVSPSKIAYRGRALALAGSSDGRFGGARAVVDLRKIAATALGAFVLPDQLEVPTAQHAFDESGNLIDEGAARSLKRLAASLAETTRWLAPELD